MFDDLQDALGIALNDTQRIALKELARRKNDTLRVYNPLPEDYYVDWGLYDQLEPGGSFLVAGASHDVGFGPGMSNQPRYIATKFFKEAASLILQSKQRQAIDAENKRRQSNNFIKLSKTIDNDEESLFLSSQGLMINSAKYIELLPTIILGIVHEYGLDVKPMQRFRRTLTLDELQSITDRKVGEGVDPTLVGVSRYKETLVETPPPSPQPQSTPTQPPNSDPLAGVAA